MSDPQDIHHDVRDNGHDDEPPAQALKSNNAEGQSPGEMLRAARDAHNYSVADLCAQTMLSRQTVAALENNEFERLSQPVFARGYYRKCAKVLDMDTEALMAAYSAWAGEPAAPRAASSTSVNVVPEDVTPGKRRTFGVVFLILLLLVALFAIYLVLPRGGTTDDTGLGAADLDLTPETRLSDQVPDAAGGDLPISLASTFAAADSESAGEPAGATTADSAPDDGGPVRSDEEAGGAIGPASPSTQATADTAAGAEEEAATATPAVAASVLTLEFDQRSWVDVRDATGEQLLVGIYQSTTRTVDGEPPYSLVLGYAPGVDVRIGGEPVEFQVTGDNTARFTVDSSAD